MAEDLELLREKKGFICDMDGVIYHGNRLLPGVTDFVAWLQRENKSFLFLTNSSERSPLELQQKLARMGLEIGEEHFYTSALATARFIASQKPHASAYVIGAPGLVGALLIGVSAAKALAYAAGKPLVPVNHIEGHVSANYVAHPDLEPPFVCLVASGGHSHIVRVEDYGVYTLLGQTMDDAAGEAFDKAARVLGLPYPGGPLLDKLSREGNPHALKLPHVQTPGRYDYSFSGLKTALINTVHKLRQNGQDVPAADIAASFQHAAVELLSDKAMLAAVETGAKTVALAGGVASNSGLRNTMNDKCQKAGLRLVMPPPILCTDNAAMIGSAAFYRLMRGEIAGLDLNACPSLRLVYPVQ